MKRLVLIFFISTIPLNATAFEMGGRDQAEIITDRSNPIKAALDSFWENVTPTIRYDRKTSVTTSDRTVVLFPKRYANDRDWGGIAFVVLGRGHKAAEVAHADITVAGSGERAIQRRIERIVLRERSMKEIPAQEIQIFSCAIEPGREGTSFVCLNNESGRNSLRISFTMGSGPFRHCGREMLVSELISEGKMRACGYGVDKTLINEFH